MGFSPVHNERIERAIASFSDDEIVGAYDRLPAIKRLFVDNYVATGNPRQAYLSTFPVAENYTNSSLGVRVHEITSNVLVQCAIAERLKQQRERLEVTPDRIVQEIAKLAFSNPQRYLARDADGNVILDENGMPRLDFSNTTEADYAALTELTEEVRTEGRGDNKTKVRTVKAKYADKRGALDMLMKRFGLYAPEKIEHSGTVDIRSRNVTVHMSVEEAAEQYARSLQDDNSE